MWGSGKWLWRRIVQLNMCWDCSRGEWLPRDHGKEVTHWTHPPTRPGNVKSLYSNGSSHCCSQQTQSWSATQDSPLSFRSKSIFNLQQKTRKSWLSLCRNYTFAFARLLDWCAVNFPNNERFIRSLSHVPKHTLTFHSAGSILEEVLHLLSYLSNGKNAKSKQ